MKVLVVTPTLGNRNSLLNTIRTVRDIGGESVKHIVVCPACKVDDLSLILGVQCVSEPENNKGIYAALNYVFFTYGRQYDYLTFINDDDYWLPEFKDLIKLAERKPYLDVIYAKTLYVDANNNVIKKQACSSQFYHFNDLFHEKVLLLTQQTTLVRSSFFFKVGGFDETFKLVADTKFWILASSLKPSYKYVKKYVSCYTLQEGQLSKDGKTQAVEHDRLWHEYPSDNMILRKLVLLWYRLSNLNVYVKRLVYK